MSIHLAIADVENFTSITISVVQEAISSIVIPAVRPLDYSHTGPAFYTWHRLMNLWFEWEIQGMLQGMGQQDYHTFRLPYWDWRTEIQTTFGVRSEELFTESRLGVTRNVLKDSTVKVYNVPNFSVASELHFPEMKGTCIHVALNISREAPLINNAFFRNPFRDLILTTVWTDAKVMICQVAKQ